jgi:hypothetical protein
MGFKAGQVIKGEIPNNVVDPLEGLPPLSKKDFEYLFLKLENMNFKGSELESATKLILKLQELYLYYDDKNLL